MGNNYMDYIYKYKSPLGDITMASDGISLIGLWFDGQKYAESTISSDVKEKELPIFNDTCKWLDLYFLGQDPHFIPKILLKGSEFRKDVWDILLKIPYGTTMTYKEIADIIAKERGIDKMSAQAVGGAVGHNPISIIVPCHRVVGTNGSLTGYAGGIDKKIQLLDLENIDMNKFFIPKK